jgi:tRNA 2-thiouridine synthesizing protein A
LRRVHGHGVGRAWQAGVLAVNDTAGPGIVRRLDASGLTCPLPVLKARKSLAAMQPGDRLELISTDAASALDVPVFCHQAGHLLLEQRRESDRWIFVIEKRHP